MKERVYMVMDWADKKATEIKGCPNIGVEYLGNCNGRIIRESGEMIGYHFSSTLDFLRYDLTNKLDNPEEYEIVDLIGQECPERFKRKEAPK
jgi:hypothetical protein